MENGIERVDVAQLGSEGNLGNEEVSGDKVMERAVTGLDEYKELEEEVFVEAVESYEQLQEQGAMSEPEGGRLTAGESLEVVVNGSADVGHETETFEEAVSVPVGDENSEELVVVDGGDKVEDLVAGEIIDKIDEGGTAEGVAGNQLHGGDEISEISLLRKTEVSENVDELKPHYGTEIQPKDSRKEEVGDNQDKDSLVDVADEFGEYKEKLRDEYFPTADASHQYEKNTEFKPKELKGHSFDFVNGAHESNEAKHLVDASASVNIEHHQNNEDMSNASVIQHHGKTTSPVSHTGIEEASAGLEPSSSSAPDKSKSNGTNEEVQAGSTNFKAGIYEGSDLPLQPTEKANGVEKKNISVEVPEKKSEKDHGEKPVTDGGHVTRETQAAPKPASSSGRSSASATTPARPAGLGRAAPLLEPAPRAVQQPRANGNVSHMQSQQIEDPTNGEAEEYDETREKLQMIRVKFLRLAHRLGQTPHNVVVAQVLYRLGLAEQLRGRNGGRVGAFSFDRASAMAEQLEAAGQEPLDFSCTIMVLGKSGVGKSATINSIFDEVKFNTDAFQLGTKKVQDVVGTVQGIRVRVIDTPGLLTSWSDQRQNEKILHSVKRFIKKTPPDIVLYLDRLDVQTRDFGDMPLLRTITEIFGASIWFNAIVVLTHAASAPPDGPNGTASSYDMFVTQRSHSVQHAIRQAAGDMRLMNPVSLVENHSACRTNRAGQRVLPNGQVWKPHLLLLSFASKILAEANTLLKLQDSPPGRPYPPRSRTPPLPFLLSSLLQSRPQVKLPEEQFGDDDGLDDDLDEPSDSEDDSEYDYLPPFKSLSKAQVAKLTKTQKKAYFDELEYREKLFMKKQLKEEKKRRKMMKKLAEAVRDMPNDSSESAEEDVGGAASVPVPLPDLVLPASFDSDNPTHRYRYLDTSNQWLVRPVLDSQGWDHDVGYEGINMERLFVVKGKIPLSLNGQISKDKKDANIQLELASSLKHGEGKATSLGFDMQSVGKDLAYTLRSETRFSNFRKNRATAGLSVTMLGDALSAGVKVEDKLILHKQFQMVMSGGAMTGRGDAAYGGSLEAQLRDKDYPLGRMLSTLGLSVMDWHGDLAVGCNVQSQVPVGRSTNLIVRANLNNRGAGQFSIRVNSTEQLQIALIGLIPLLRKLFDYSQQLQFGQ
ncbi:hypothetical protein Tsubulata_044066 [Turnera subulata]|uniref:AIG1-type G domain-containing protein n=1 Tax=Turnera subulata TaxID=218843 RepID=A0A9Q0GD72_9ROSI|nr:hypothetical protein Tsubulata_044066 [Turnera subulata]